MATLPGFKRLPGRSERFLNEKTGETISRRKYDLLRRGISNETLAKINRTSEPKKQLARPARGRKSILKLPENIVDELAIERSEERARKERLKALEKERRKVDRNVEKLKNKKIKTPKFSGRLLKKGRKARRLPFEEYSQYSKYWDEMKKSGIVFAYSVGVSAVDTRIGYERDAIVFTLKTFSKKISEPDFNEAMINFLESKSYLEFLNYFIHIAFSESYYKSK